MLCEQAARIRSFFFFFLFSPFFIQRAGVKGKKTPHNSQCSNKVCFDDFLYFTYIKEPLLYRQRKPLVRGHAKDAYVSGHIPKVVSFIPLTSCFKFCFLKQYLCLEWYKCKQNLFPYFKQELKDRIVTGYMLIF